MFKENPDVSFGDVMLSEDGVRTFTFDENGIADGRGAHIRGLSLAV